MCQWICACVSVCVRTCACVCDGWVAACLFVRAGLTTTSWHESWFRLEGAAASQLWCLLQSLNVAEPQLPLLGSALLHFWCITVTLQANRQDVVSLSTIICFIHIILLGHSIPLKGGIWARSALMFVMYIFFFYFDMWYLFSPSQGVWRSAPVRVTQVFAVCFAALLLNPHEHVCKYRPLKARTQNTNM